MATAVVLGLLAMDKNEPQPTGNAPGLEQAVLDRLTDIDRRLALLEASPGSVPPIHPLSNPSEIKQLIERIDNLEKRDASSMQGLEQTYQNPTRGLLRPQTDAVAAQPAPAEIAASHFQEAGALGADDTEYLEDLDSIFDQGELPNTTLSQIDCRAGYCRLEYSIGKSADNYSTSSEGNGNYSDSSIEENELTLKLAEKYGQGITMYKSTSPDGKKVVYIKHGRE